MAVTTLGLFDVVYSTDRVSPIVIAYLHPFTYTYIETMNALFSGIASFYTRDAEILASKMFLTLFGFPGG